MSSNIVERGTTEAAARAEMARAEAGKYIPTLDDGLRWERLGLGRVFFENGVPTWYGLTDVAVAA